MQASETASSELVSIIDMPQSSIDNYLRDILSGRASAQEIEIADAIIAYYYRNSSPLIFDEGRLWYYDPTSGVYAPLEDASISSIVYDLDRAPLTEGMLRVKVSFANAIVRAIKNRVSKTGFFLNAPEGVAVANGFLTFDPEVGDIRMDNVSSEQRQRHRLSIPYIANSEPGHVDDFLYDTFRDQELVNLIYEIIGVALFGQGYRYHTMVVFHGEGANGKGVITKLIQKLIPKGMRSSVPPSEWRVEYQRYPLVGSRFNAVGELPKLTRDNMETLKGISAGDTITARRIGSSGFEFQPTAQHVFSTNHLPSLPETGVAIERRFLIIPFNRIVAEDKRDPNMADDLFRLGALGFLRCAVDGFQRVLQQKGFSRPDIVRIATLKWMHNSNPIILFAKCHLEYTGNAEDRITAAEMLNKCQTFCVDNKLPPPSSQRALKTSLEELGFTSTKSSTMQWTGVQWKT
jgi:putative DNA primase/helicase